MNFGKPLSAFGLCQMEMAAWAIKASQRDQTGLQLPCGMETHQYLKSRKDGGWVLSVQTFDSTNWPWFFVYGGFLSHGGTPSSPSYGWPWLSIESPGDDWGSPMLIPDSHQKALPFLTRPVDQRQSWWPVNTALRVEPQIRQRKHDIIWSRTR
jgi:hypothetical protein